MEALLNLHVLMLCPCPGCNVFFTNDAEGGMLSAVHLKNTHGIEWTDFVLDQPETSSTPLEPQSTPASASSTTSSIFLLANTTPNTAPPLKCTTCGQSFLAQADLDQHMEIHNEPARGQYRRIRPKSPKEKWLQCLHCHYGDDSVVGIRRHMEERHPDKSRGNHVAARHPASGLPVDRSSSNETSSIIVDSLRSSRGDKSIPNPKELRVHLTGRGRPAKTGRTNRNINDVPEEERDRFKCQYCEKQYLSERSKRTHIRNFHRDEWIGRPAKRNDSDEGDGPDGEHNTGGNDAFGDDGNHGDEEDEGEGKALECRSKYRKRKRD